MVLIVFYFLVQTYKRPIFTFKSLCYNQTVQPINFKGYLNENRKHGSALITLNMGFWLKQVNSKEYFKGKTTCKICVSSVSG